MDMEQSQDNGNANPSTNQTYSVSLQTNRMWDKNIRIAGNEDIGYYAILGNIQIAGPFPHELDVDSHLESAPLTLIVNIAAAMIELHKKHTEHEQIPIPTGPNTGRKEGETITELYQRHNPTLQGKPNHGKIKDQLSDYTD